MRNEVIFFFYCGPRNNYGCSIVGCSPTKYMNNILEEKQSPKAGATYFHPKKLCQFLAFSWVQNNHGTKKSNLIKPQQFPSPNGIATLGHSFIDTDTSPFASSRSLLCANFRPLQSLCPFLQNGLCSVPPLRPSLQVNSFISQLQILQHSTICV